MRWRSDLGVSGASGSRCIARTRPKLGRIACPRLIRRFFDREALFECEPTAVVLALAEQRQVAALEIPEATIAREGERRSFDTLPDAPDPGLPARDLLAHTVRGTVSDGLALAAPAVGLLAASLGLSRPHDGNQPRWRP